jgi:hypothetical protein
MAGMTQSRVSEDMDEEEWENAAFAYTHLDGEYTVNPELDQKPYEHCFLRVIRK